MLAARSQHQNFDSSVLARVQCPFLAVILVSAAAQAAPRCIKPCQKPVKGSFGLRSCGISVETNQ